MAALEAEAEALAAASAAQGAQGSALPGFVSAGIIQQGNTGQAKEAGEEEGGRGEDNPEEIDLDAGGGEEGAEEGEKQGRGGRGRVRVEEGVQVKAVPAGVFGSLAPPGATNGQQGDGEEQLGARERFKKRKV